MPTQLLSRSSRPAPRGLELHPEVILEQARVHELCGPARRTLALWIAARTQGPVLWISPAWVPERINPDGLRPLLDPARLILVTPERAEDLLWCCEEALRAGVVSLIVADLPGPPGLTPVRRMHLAAETAAAMRAAPIGLLLTPGDGGARGVESRWHLAPAHAGSTRRWRLERRRARAHPPRAWQARQGREGIALERAADQAGVK